MAGKINMRFTGCSGKAFRLQAGIGTVAVVSPRGDRMRDLQSTKLIWLKGWLFLFLGIVSAGLVFLEAPSLKVALLLALAVWSFCRTYYFAFYVLERYVDPGYKFSGLGSFLGHLFRRKKSGGG